MPKLSFDDAAEKFDVTLVEAAEPRRFVLFAVGAGGNPERHLPLLTRLAEQGSTVIAPHFERLASPNVTDQDLLLRARRLRLSLDAAAGAALPVVGVGHSIGTAVLLALAGGRLWTRRGESLAIAPEARLGRLALLAPATGFFQVPGALDAIKAPVLAWAATLDTITPPQQAEFLKLSLGARVPVELRIAEGAGHFSFMNLPPPHTTEPLPDREAFLAQLAGEVCRFVSV